MFTAEQSQYLLQLPKKVEANGLLQDNLEFNQSFPFQERYTLLSPDDADFTFFYEINQSKKNHFKLTLYLMEDDTKVGLIRVDFSGQHENPQTLKDSVPQMFHSFAGKFFDFADHHIHYYVEGYKTTLDWAMPLRYDSFPVKQITKNNDILDAFYSFNGIINLKTKFKIHPLLI